MDCITAQDNFLAYSRGEPVPAELVDHIASCEACAKAFREFAEVGRLLAAMDPVTVREGFADSVAAAVQAQRSAPRGPGASRMLLAGSLAAAVLLVVGVVGFGALLGGPRPKSESMGAEGARPAVVAMEAAPAEDKAFADSATAPASSAAKAGPAGPAGGRGAVPVPNASMAELASEGAGRREWAEESGPGVYSVRPSPGETRISLALEGVPTRDALSLVARRFGTVVEFETSSAALPRVTLVLENVTEEEAVRRICEAAGLSARRRADGVYIVGDKAGL